MLFQYTVDKAIFTCVMALQYNVSRDWQKYLYENSGWSYHLRLFSGSKSF